jgi:protein-histidine pros-kinase
LRHIHAQPAVYRDRAILGRVASDVTSLTGESAMKLRVNLVLLAVAVIVVELFAVVSTPFLQNIARSDVLQRARIMMEAAAGIRTYTSNEIAPLLTANTEDARFHAQTVPAYAASKNFAVLASKFRDYAYREAALNPMNPANRAVDWEADIIGNFRTNPFTEELITERETEYGRVLNLSHPIVSGERCLACHGTVERAPRAMVALYGTQNGFGWKLNEIVAAQIVSVPMAVALEQSARIRNLFLCVLTGVFFLLIGLFNLLPILVATLSRGEGRKPDTTRPHVTTADTIRAFGYGLFAAGMAVPLVLYVVTYARGGGVGLQEALNPFEDSNYASLAAVVPGAVTIWLASYLRATLSQSSREQLP